ncbi:MAG TPA: extracellular solute-binding protein [candidate division Zixibacteria bacterium]|nr:extracellular solute-binding protein [candidate division Zixibacteria bacterium]
MNRKWSLLILVLLFSLVLAACSADEAEPEADADADTGVVEEPAVAVEQDFISWYQYDQNNEDPASDERVGNEYLRSTIPQFNEAFDGKWNWINQPKAFDKMTTELVAAVQAGGDVPDVYELSNSQDIIPLHKNGALQDLTSWAQAQSWFSDLDSSGVEGCKGPDGKLYCIPLSQRPQLVYVWADRFPDGYPTTPEGFLEEAARLKEEGLYAITFFGSTDKGGEGFSRAIWTTMASFGGTIDDGQENMLLNTPENIAAIEFLREIVANEYVPEIAFAGGFQEEEAFKDSSAGSFPTGLFGYRYVNPLTAPDGTAYDKGSAEDMLDAIAAGDVFLSPFVSPDGQDPSCGVDVAGLVIPTGAKNVEGAYEYINWIMDPEQNAEWVAGPGGGFPVLKATQSHELFQQPFYVEAAKAVGASSCRPWHGSLQRPNEAQELVMQAVYKLMKEDPTADIAEVLTATEEEYNSAN